MTEPKAKWPSEAIALSCNLTLHHWFVYAIDVEHAAIIGYVPSSPGWPSPDGMFKQAAKVLRDVGIDPDNRCEVSHPKVLRGEKR